MKTKIESPAKKSSAKKTAATGPNASQTKGRKKKARKGSGQGRLSIAHPNAAGVDVGSREHFVSVPADRDEKPVRSFSAYTDGLQDMAEWLKASKVDTVAMEATGVYWIPVYQILEQAGFQVLLVDAYSVKHVPGRKSDVLDCQWIQQLHTYGLLRAAFRPDDEICRLRTLQRHRKSLVEASSMFTLHMQKALDEMNLHLHKVLSDITGESGLRMLDAILAGERNPQVLAALADCRVRKTPKEIQSALTGDYREEELFVLGHALANYRHQQNLIKECDEAILRQLEKISARSVPPEEPRQAPPTPPKDAATNAPQPKPKKVRKTSTERAWHEQLLRIAGVDLTQLPGIGVLAALILISEIGTDMAKWRSPKAFASWLGLCPNHKISGGRILSNRTRRVKCRSADILRVAAGTLGKTDTPLGAFYRRKKAQLGAPKALTATARKLACLVYQLLSNAEGYRPETARAYELRFKKQTLSSLRKRAAKLGYELTELPQAA
jgi:transposase